MVIPRRNSGGGFLFNDPCFFKCLTPVPNLPILRAAMSSLFLASNFLAPSFETLAKQDGLRGLVFNQKETLILAQFKIIAYLCTYIPQTNKYEKVDNPIAFLRCPGSDSGMRIICE